MQNKKAFEWLAKKKIQKKKIESITQEGPLKKMRKQSDNPVNHHIGETGKI